MSPTGVAAVRLTRDSALGAAVGWFLEGRRLDMRALAREVGVGRSTLYRWFTSREALLGGIAWTIKSDTITRIEARDRGGGGPRERFLRVYGRLTETGRDFPPLVTFVADDPDFALRVLISRYGTVQGHLIAWVSGHFGAMPEIAPEVDRDDLAYAIVRLAFLWSDMITGSPPRAGTAISMVELLLTGACAGVRPQPRSLTP